MTRISLPVLCNIVVLVLHCRSLPNMLLDSRLTSRSPMADAKLSALPPASSSSGLIRVLRFEISLARISFILSIVSPLSNGLKIFPQ